MPGGARERQRPRPPRGAAAEAARGAQLLIDLKYANQLPKPPVPKLLRALPSAERLFQYRPTSLELDHRPFLLAEEELLNRLELVDPEAYGEPSVRGSMPPPPAPVDAQLLRDDDVGQEVREAELKRRRLTERTEASHRQAFGLQLPLLITNDVFTERQRHTTGTEAAEKKLERHPPGFASVQELADKIEQSFVAAQEAPVHPTKPGMRAKRVLPIVPDAVLWTNRYRQVVFDEVPVDPSRNDLLFKTTPNPRSTCFGFFSPVDGTELGSYSLMQNYVWSNRGEFTRRNACGEGQAILLSFPREATSEDSKESAAGEVRFVQVPTLMRLTKQKAMRLDLSLDLQALSVKHRDQTPAEIEAEAPVARQVLVDEAEEVDKSEASLDYIDGQWVIHQDPRSQGKSSLSRPTGAESSALESQLLRSEAGDSAGRALGLFAGPRLGQVGAAPAGCQRETMHAVAAGASCWTRGFEYEFCCVPPAGFASCFDGVAFTYEGCCSVPGVRPANTTPRLPALPSRPRPAPEALKVDLVVRACGKHRDQLEELFRSLEVFWPFRRWQSRVHVVLDAESELDRSLCAREGRNPWPQWVHCVNEVLPAALADATGAVRAQFGLFLADVYAPGADFVAVVDSDCVFHTFGIPELSIVWDRAGRPRPVVFGAWHVQYFDQPRALGLPWTAEFMHTPFMLVRKEHYAAARAFVAHHVGVPGGTAYGEETVPAEAPLADRFDAVATSFGPAYAALTARIRERSRKCWWRQGSHRGQEGEDPIFHQLMGHYLYHFRRGSYHWSVRDGLPLGLDPVHTCPSLLAVRHLSNFKDRGPRRRSRPLAPWEERAWAEGYRAEARAAVWAGLCAAASALRQAPGAEEDAHGSGVAGRADDEVEELVQACNSRGTMVNHSHALLCHEPHAHGRGWDGPSQAHCGRRGSASLLAQYRALLPHAAALDGLPAGFPGRRPAT
ncbi:unnamed protein product [Prorocentrum cordatum]|nr:unnamed protein product [Polarella glacialis]